MNSEELLFTNCMKNYNDSIMFMAEKYGMLMSVNKKSGAISIVCKLPENAAIYRSFIRDNGNILLFPYGKGDVCIYNENDKKIDFIKIPDGVFLEREINWAANYLKVGKFLFFYWADSVIIRYDLEMNTWKAYREWNRFLDEKEIEFKGFNRGAFCKDGKVVFHLTDTRYLIFLDLVKDTIDIKEIKIPTDYNISNILYDENNNEILLNVVIKNKIIIGEMEVDNLIFRELTEIEFVLDSPQFLMELCENNLFLLPINHDNAFVINIDNGSYEKLKGLKLMNYLKLQKAGKYPFNFLYGEKIGNMYYCFNLKSGELVSLNMISKQVSNIGLFENKGLRIDFINKIRSYCIIHEGDIVGIDDFISSL